jgi:hypothetical protein
MADGDTELMMQELVAIRRDLATLLTGMEAAAVRQETIIAALEALRADLARIVEASNGERLEPPVRHRLDWVSTGVPLRPPPRSSEDAEMTPDPVP